MSYASQFALAMDAGFRDRVTACAVSRAVAQSQSTDPAVAALGVAVIAAAENALGLIKLVAGNPAFSAVEDPASVTDSQILSAVDAAWPVYAKALYPPATAGPPHAGVLPADADGPE